MIRTKHTACSLLTLLAVGTSAHADIQYTNVMSMVQDGKLVPLSTTTTFLKKGLQRDDTEQKIATFTRSESAITNVARREIITLDPALKIYTISSLDGSALAADASNVKTTAAKPTAKGKGKMVMTLGAQFLGNEKLLDYTTRHYKTSMETDSSGCCGDGKTALKVEQWMADLELPVLDAGAASKAGEGFGGMGDLNCDITFERKGDVNGFDAANKGLAIKRITFDDKGKMLMQQQITMLSLAALDDARFAAPADFKKLSREEYDAKRQNAMIAAMTGAGKGTPDADEPAGAEAPADGDAAETAPKEKAKPKLKGKLRLPF